MKNILVRNTNINPEHENVKGKSVDELKVTNIFSHLGNGEQNEAYLELYNKLNPKSETKKIKAEKPVVTVTD